MPGPKFVLAALPLLLAGCGGEGPFERAAVEGIVTLDGQPLEAGTIVFEPAPGTPGPKAAAQITGGRYALPAAAGPAVGSHKVRITAKDPGMPGPQDDRLAFDPSLAAELIPADPAPPLPARYNTATTLAAEVAGVFNTLDFDLTAD